MALADVYDALISRRVYKPAFPHAKAVQMIREGRGTHFDPEVTDAFLANPDEFLGVAERYTDTEEAVARTVAWSNWYVVRGRTSPNQVQSPASESDSCCSAQ